MGPKGRVSRRTQERGNLGRAEKDAGVGQGWGGWGGTQERTKVEGGETQREGWAKWK